MARPRSFSSPTRCGCPTSLSRVLGRMRSASGVPFIAAGSRAIAAVNSVASSPAGARVFDLAILGRPLAENGRADADHRSAFGDGDLEIVGHAHRKLGEGVGAAVQRSERAKPGKKPPF